MISALSFQRRPHLVFPIPRYPWVTRDQGFHNILSNKTWSKSCRKWIALRLDLSSLLFGQQHSSVWRSHTAILRAERSWYTFGTRYCLCSVDLVLLFCCSSWNLAVIVSCSCFVPWPCKRLPIVELRQFTSFSNCFWRISICLYSQVSHQPLFHQLKSLCYHHQAACFHLLEYLDFLQHPLQLERCLSSISRQRQQRMSIRRQTHNSNTTTESWLGGDCRRLFG